MLFFETKFYFYLGCKKFDKAFNLLKKYSVENGKSYKFYKYSVYYFFEQKDCLNAFYNFLNCILIKPLDFEFENWGIKVFIENIISKGDLQFAAKNAMKLADLENLSDTNRKKLIKILDYIKTKI